MNGRKRRFPVRGRRGSRMWFFAWFFAGLFAGVLLGFFLAGLCNISAKKKERYIGSGPDSEKKIEDAA